MPRFLTGEMLGRMRSNACLATMLLAVSAAFPALGEEQDRRFTFTTVDSWLIRLDGRTGEVSLCAPTGAAWLCRAAPDARAGQGEDLARLLRENAELKATLAAPGAAAPGSAVLDRAFVFLAGRARAGLAALRLSGRP